MKPRPTMSRATARETDGDSVGDRWREFLQQVGPVWIITTDGIRS